MWRIILILLLFAGCGDQNSCFIDGTCIPTPPENPTPEDVDIAFEELEEELRKCKKKLKKRRYRCHRQ